MKYPRLPLERTSVALKTRAWILAWLTRLQACTSNYYCNVAEISMCRILDLSLEHSDIPDFRLAYINLCCE